MKKLSLLILSLGLLALFSPSVNAFSGGGDSGSGSSGDSDGLLGGFETSDRPTDSGNTRTIGSGNR